MRYKKRSAKTFGKQAGLFLNATHRAGLLESISSNKELWLRWVAKTRGCLKNLDEGDYNKFSELIVAIENNFSKQSKPSLDLISFLTEKVESYRNYDFYTKEERAEQRSFYRRIIEKSLSFFIGLEVFSDSHIRKSFF